MVGPNGAGYAKLISIHPPCWIWLWCQGCCKMIHHILTWNRSGTARFHLTERQHSCTIVLAAIINEEFNWVSSRDAVTELPWKKEFIQSTLKPQWVVLVGTALKQSALNPYWRSMSAQSAILSLPRNSASWTPPVVWSVSASVSTCRKKNKIIGYEKKGIKDFWKSFVPIFVCEVICMSGVTRWKGLKELFFSSSLIPGRGIAARQTLFAMP